MMKKVSHHCHARGCIKPVPRAMLMCHKHWYMVPLELRRRVWATYQPGQEEGRAEVSKEWHEAADAAIKAVADKEAAAS